MTDFTIEKRYGSVTVDTYSLLSQIDDNGFHNVVTAAVDGGDGEWMMETTSDGFAVVLYAEGFAIAYMYLHYSDLYSVDGYELTSYASMFTDDGAPCCRAMVTAPGEHEIDCPWQ